MENMRTDIIDLCKRVVKNEGLVKALSDNWCYDMDCKICPFSSFNNPNDHYCCEDTDEHYVEIAKMYLKENGVD